MTPRGKQAEAGRRRPTISRRAFLCQAAVAALSAGLLAACGGNPTGSVGANTSVGSATAAAVARAAASSATAMSSAPSSTAATSTAASASTTATTTAAASAAASGPTPTPGPPIFGKGSVSLLFLNGLGGADGETMKQMMASYAQQHPNVSIDFQTLSWPDVFAKLDTLLAGGTPPELVIMHVTEMPEYGNRAALQPVDDWFARKLLPKDDFSQIVMEKATWNGKVQGVPLDIHDYNSYASVDMLRQAGFDASKPPIGQDFMDMAQKLSHDPTDPAKATFGTANFGSFGSMALLWQYGGDVLSADGTTVTFGDQPALDGMQMLNDLIYKYHVYPQPGVKYSNLRVLGRVAYYTGGSWDLNYYKDNHIAPPEVAAAQFPQIGPKRAVWMNSHILCIPVGVTGTKFDEAQKLILWISDHGVDWARAGHPPARISQQNSPELQQDWAWEVRVFAKVTSQWGRYEVSPPTYTQVRDLQYKAIGEVTQNKKPVKTILDDYARQITAVLAQ